MLHGEFKMILEMINFVLHIDKYIEIIINSFGMLTYLIMFIIIFCETGLVFTPFLPGDSLLFVLGAFSASGILNIFLIYTLLLIASILGDSINYVIGKLFGEKISQSRWVKKEYLDKTREFYKKYGGKTIILARFVPIVRTFAPFIAGIGNMRYNRFLSFNILGGFLWVTILLFAGYFFGNIPFISNNLSLVIYIIIVLSVLPPIVEIIRAKLKVF
jgi:membrane-associated protein